MAITLISYFSRFVILKNTFWIKYDFLLFFVFSCRFDLKDDSDWAVRIVLKKTFFLALYLLFRNNQWISCINTLNTFDATAPSVTQKFCLCLKLFRLFHTQKKLILISNFLLQPFFASVKCSFRLQKWKIGFCNNFVFEE